MKEVPTLCYMCYSRCAVRAQTAEGLVVSISGEPGHPNSMGKVCAKGKAGIMGLYDPYRITAPLVRTNPQKGLGIDPGWKEIGWEEALDLACEKLGRIRERDPRRLVFSGIDFQMFAFYSFFASAFGTPNICKGGPEYFCGNGLHSVLFLTQGSFYAELDFDHCDYCLLIGTQYGFMARTAATGNANRMAEARTRGMKVVVVDPVGTNAAAKADEWIPIRPGTDGALALAMINVLVNELGIYDAEFLRQHTNGPYLIGPDGHYRREEKTGKPLVWNRLLEKAGPYDGWPAKELALEGTYQVGGVSCQPAFQVLKDFAYRWVPEDVAPITGVPAETIRRLSRQFGQAAKVGSTFMTEGQELPFRPAAALWTRGAIAHKNGMMTGFAIQLLNILVGAIDVPGGLLGSRTKGPFWEPKEGPDGMLVPHEMQLVEAGAFPARKAKRPETLGLDELFVVGPYGGPTFEEVILDPDRYGIDYRPEAMIICLSNLMMSTCAPERMAQVLKKIPFVLCFSTHLDETTAFADLVLPDAHYLERFTVIPNFFAVAVHPGPGSWYFNFGQPAAQAKSSVRYWPEVLMEIAERLGFLEDFNAILNQFLRLKEPYLLAKDRRYSLAELADAWAKFSFGPEHDLDWFQRHGTLRFKKKELHEVYPRSFIQGRIPIYLEHFLAAGRDVAEVTKELGIPWETEAYQPLPHWRPCAELAESGDGRDLFAVNYKLPFHTFTVTAQNSWLSELGQHHPYAYKIMIHEETARKRGISDGDAVELESKSGKVRGVAKLTQCIHPEVLGIAGIFGHWAVGLPVALNKGTHFNSLLSSSLSAIDPLSAALDACIRVRIAKAE